MNKSTWLETFLSCFFLHHQCIKQGFHSVGVQYMFSMWWWIFLSFLGFICISSSHMQIIIFLTSSKSILHLSHFQEAQIISDTFHIKCLVSCCYFKFYHFKNTKQSLPLMYKWLKMFNQLFYQFLCSLSFSPSLPYSCRFHFLLKASD